MSGLTADFGGGLYLIDLPQKMPGFRRFISSWFFRDGAGRRVVVDPGPASTIPLLLKELEALTDGVDLVLLTHIHLDHSGGIAEFCARYPRAAVLAHPRAFRHLREPRKLWDASVRTLGDIALMYGEPAPLGTGTPLWEEDDRGLIEVFQTPGHAPHHLSFRVSTEGRPLFFIGEAAGMALPAQDGNLWLRPTTPPRFDAEAALNSMQLILSALRGDEKLCYAHWGMAEGPKERVELALEQTQRWLEATGTMGETGPEEMVSWFLERDPLLRAALDPDLLERERRFMVNSVRGMRECLSATPSPSSASGEARTVSGPHQPSPE